MAQRYGSTHSPGATPQGGWSGRRRSRIGARVNALYIAPVPLLLTAWGQAPFGLATDIAAFFVLIGAAHLTKDGLRAEEAFESRTVARRPALPRKMLGTAAIAAGLFLAGLPSLGGGIILGLLGAALHVGAFGIDPLRNKMPEGAPAWQSERVAEAVDEAETHLAEMKAALARTGDRKLLSRAEGFVSTARGLFRRVEEDPRDLPQARRWLGVYLLGARDAARKYADLAAREDAPNERARFLALLDDLEQGFAKRSETMLLDDRADLGIEIDVLRERLDREGVTLERQGD